MDAADQVAVLFAAGEGYTDSIAVEDVPHYADALLARIHRTYPELHALVHSGKKHPPEALERLRALADETLKNLWMHHPRRWQRGGTPLDKSA